VRGDVEIVALDGTVLPRRRRTIALCRCGLSALKPFCDGSHKAAGFRA
jgi:CDGSH-type Zn-finger protein